jgi:hypothetical protein
MLRLNNENSWRNTGTRSGQERSGTTPAITAGGANAQHLWGSFQYFASVFSGVLSNKYRLEASPIHRVEDSGSRLEGEWER